MFVIYIHKLLIEWANLVSHFYLLRDGRKGKESVRVKWKEEKGEGGILIQTESVYRKPEAQ